MAYIDRKFQFAQAKKIPLQWFVESYLQLSYERQSGSELWYKSPFSPSQDTASFHINTNLNRWYDFLRPDIKGGDSTELLAQIRSCSLYEALDELNHAGLIDNPQKAISTPSKNTPLKSHTEATDGDKDKSSTLPTITELKAPQWAYLTHRYGEQAGKYLAKQFNLKGFYNSHIGFPIKSGYSWGFIPLDKSKDQMFYRGSDRTPQIFPNDLTSQQHASGIFVVEGEKDVFAIDWKLHELNLKPEWAVITNTHGAGNLSESVELFRHFDPKKVKNVIIAYDNDTIGQEANQKAYKIAKGCFGEDTTIAIIDFERLLHTPKPKGYDMSDFLNEGHSLKMLLPPEKGQSKQIELGI